MDENEFLISNSNEKARKLNYFLIFLVIVLSIVVVGLIVFILIPEKGLPNYQKYHDQFMKNVNRTRIGEFMKEFSSFPHLAGKKKFLLNFFLIKTEFTTK